MVLYSFGVWPAVILHGAGNFFVQSIFDHLTLDSENTKYLVGEFGLVGGIILLVAAYIFWKMRNNLPKLHHENE